MTGFWQKLTFVFKREKPAYGGRPSWDDGYAYEIPDYDAPPDPDGPTTEQVNAWSQAVVAELQKRSRTDELIADAQSQQGSREQAFALDELDQLGIGIHIGQDPFDWPDNSPEERERPPA